MEQVQPKGRATGGGGVPRGHRTISHFSISLESKVGKVELIQRAEWEAKLGTLFTQLDTDFQGM